MMVAQAFVGQGYPMSLVARLADLPRGNFYDKPSKNVGNRGRRYSNYTCTVDHQMIGNDVVVEKIKQLLEMEFVDYGYLKVCHWLRQNLFYIINPKKVYRLMKENGLLNNMAIHRPKMSSRLWVKDLYLKPTTPLVTWKSILSLFIFMG